MASPSTVITLGYGSFGSVNLLPTLGFGIGEAAEAPGYGWLEYTAKGRAHYHATGPAHYSAKGRSHYSSTGEPIHYTATGRTHYTAPEDDS